MKRVLVGAMIVLMIATNIVSAAPQSYKILGEDRYDTARNVADGYGDYDTAILVNGDSVSDGLSASSLAGKEKAPILLCKKDKLPKATEKGLLKANRVFIIGGYEAVSAEVENSIIGKDIIRLGGITRTETSEMVAEYLGDYNKAFIVNGFNGGADALSIAPVSARDSAPIILTDGKTPGNPNPGTHNYVIGGKSAVSDKVKTAYKAKRISGDDRYETNLKVLKEFYPHTNKLYCADGESLIDALTVSPLAKNHGVLLVSKTSDKRVLVGKQRIQVGGMGFEIVDLTDEDIYLQYINSPKVRNEAKSEFYRLLQKRKN